MTDSIDQYLWYQSFDYSIKIKHVLMIIALFTIIFLEEVGRFFIAVAELR
jgi:hypothetical protein